MNIKEVGDSGKPVVLICCKGCHCSEILTATPPKLFKAIETVKDQLSYAIGPSKK